VGPVALYVIGTPIGNLADITLRALETLKGASVVYAEDTRHTRRLFDRYDITTPLRSLHEHNEEGRIDEVWERLRAGQDVALVSDAGTPLVSDPGYRLVSALAELGATIVPVPGASAVLSALTASGLASDRFVFLGFPPRKGGSRTRFLERIAFSAETAVLFESPTRLGGLLEDLAASAGPGRAVVIAREMTKLHEEFFRGSVSEALAWFAQGRVRGEITVVVAPRPCEAEPAEPAVVQAFVAERLGKGARRKEVVLELMDRFGLKKNDAYARVHSPQEPE